MINIAVIMGGPSSEYDVSLKSGQNVIRHLNNEKYRVLPIEVSKSETWQCGKFIDNKDIVSWDVRNFLDNNGSCQSLSANEAMGWLKKEKAVIAFLAMHGRYGEDGRLQSFLELSGIKYTGSGPLASSLAIHKAGAKRLCQGLGFKMAEDIRIIPNSYQCDKNGIIDKLHGLGKKVVLKLMDSGSSLDMVILENPSKNDIEENLAGLLKSGEVLGEQFIQGTELTCGVLEKIHLTPEEVIVPEALAVTEIRPRDDSFFSYEAKYTPGATDEITPAPVSRDITKKIQDFAIRCHQGLGCSGYSRSDFILADDPDNGDLDIYFLETNTLPGLTKTSLLPQGAGAIGINMGQLLDRIISLGLYANK